MKLKRNFSDTPLTKPRPEFDSRVYAISHCPLHCVLYLWCMTRKNVITFNKTFLYFLDKINIVKNRCGCEKMKYNYLTQFSEINFVTKNRWKEIKCWKSIVVQIYKIVQTKTIPSIENLLRIVKSFQYSLPAYYYLFFHMFQK